MLHELVEGPGGITRRLVRHKCILERFIILGHEPVAVSTSAVRALGTREDIAVDAPRTERFDHDHSRDSVAFRLAPSINVASSPKVTASLMWTNSPNSAWKTLPVDDDASHHPRSNQRPEASLNTRRASQQNRNDDPIITHETNRKRLAYAVHGNKGKLGHDDHACAESSRHRAVAGLAESSFFLGGVVLSVGLLGMALVVISPSTLRDFEAGGMSVALAVESLSGLHTIVWKSSTGLDAMAAVTSGTVEMADG
ncbi:hypothetical protein DPSP01_012141 [Paraphaeosphaeria sporulosa]